MLLIYFLHGSVLMPIVNVVLIVFLPHFVRRNYWLHTALMVLFVFLALDLSELADAGFWVMQERVRDVLLGCLLAYLGTVAAFYGQPDRDPRHRRGRAPVAVGDSVRR
jgi:uncharacterized membrane protein YccC